MSDKPNDNPNPPASNDAPKTKAAEEWKPKVGAPCTAVHMRGGPIFVELPGKILELDKKTGSATVEYLNDKGRKTTLENVPYVERGAGYDRACYSAPTP